MYCWYIRRRRRWNERKPRGGSSKLGKKNFWKKATPGRTFGISANGPELLRILASMRLHGFLELIKGDYDMEHRLFLTKAIGIHADAGTQSLIAYFKSEKDAHR